MTLTRENPASRGLDLVHFVSLVKDNKRFLFYTTAIFVVAAICLAFILPVRYQANAVVALRANDQSSSVLSGLQQNLGLAANFLGAADTSPYQVVAFIKSEDFTDRFLMKERLLPSLFPEQWDNANKRWQADPSLSARLGRVLSGVFGSEQNSGDAPSLASAFLKFDKIRDASYSTRTGLITVSIEWADPEVAAEWVNLLVRDVNDYLREKDKHESDRKLQYYRDQANSETNAQARTRIYQLMQNEIEKLAVLFASQEYKVKVVDSAHVPAKRYRPQRMVIITLGLVIGFLLSLSYIVLKEEFYSTSRANGRAG